MGEGMESVCFSVWKMEKRVVTILLKNQIKVMESCG